ncbi:MULTISPECIES: hypothetical protein [unclassified Proteiniphilum]|nr:MULTISPECIES: hypothetical protein [unclassified Proteiniphilum]
MMSKEIPFMTPFAPKSAIITDYEHKDTVNAPFSLVRLTNKKVVYMSKENGVMQPFFIKAIETGYWDTRYHPDTDYNKVFADMKGIGANTAYVMLHWEDIETQDNKFDFSFSDKVTNAAAKQGLKIKWILFLHAQRDKVPTEKPETAWTFHLDNRDSANYTMQWPKRNGKVYKDIKSLLEDGGIRPLHVYGHPEIFHRIRRMLYKLAVHYRDDPTVLGIQLGNEEGFSFLDESDFNPVTSALYEEWKLKTNKTDYALFKKDAMDWWWKQFTTAYHEGDPYKIISFNLDAGQAEANDPKRVEMTGTSAATYADGNLDAIGTMLYKHWGEKALLGLDIHYGNMYNYRLPVLIPSEIGIGSFNSLPYFRRFTAQTLERAAQGFGVYCYGEVREELPNKVTEREALTRIFSNITSNVDIIYPGLPGPGYAVLTAKDDNIKISHLNLDGGKTLALIYDLTGIEITDNLEGAKNEDVAIQCSVTMPGKYAIKVYTSKEEKKIEKFFSETNSVFTFTVSDFDKTDLAFIRIEQINSERK